VGGASVLLVSPASSQGGEWAAGPRVKPELVSVWSHLRREGSRVELLDAECDADAAPQADAMSQAGAAHLVALACLSPLQYGAALAVARRVRETRPQAVTAVFGQHATMRPDDFSAGAADGLFDWVVQGDAEVSLSQIAADAVAAGRAERACRVGVGEPLPLTEQTLPDYAGYPCVREGLASLGVYLSRGCQYHSALCYAGPGGGQWRAFPPETAFGLLVRLEELRPHEIAVLDPTFGLDTGWRAAVLGRLADVERRAVPLSLTARPEAFARRDVDAVYRGRLHLHLSIGSLSPSLLAALEVPRPRQTLERILDLIRYANAKGVPAELDLVFGQPGETRATAAETLDTLEELIGSFPNTSLRPVARAWAYVPFGDVETDVKAPARRFGTAIVHPEWWKDDVPSFAAAHAVVPSADLLDLPPGDDSYWRPRFEAVAAAFAAKLTQEARRGLRSHEGVGSMADHVPHGFWREPRWH